MVSVFLTIAGFIVGLGAATVIDSLGFLGRKSPYWTETTIRAHKVTKPLIWIGIFTVLIGHTFLLSDGLISKSVFTLHLIIMIIMILNGGYLSFKISPELLKREKEGKANEILPKEIQKKITLSFLVSIISWWGLLILTIDKIFI